MSPKEKSSVAEHGLANAALPLAREPIAIIGIGCRYPGISNPGEFWQTLIAGREAVGPYPGGRFAELDRMFAEAGRPRARVRTDRGGFLKDVAGFDAQFFEISPREAVYIDPQHRLLLEVAWEALEDAGQVRENYAGSRTGVYSGVWTGEYESRLYESATASDFYSLTGCLRASASGRVSFALGLEGPSLTVDTSCSSSLLAVHLACRDLWAGDIGMALAGGANLTLGPELFELFTKAKMLSPEGRCKFGDASADGFVRSEGAAMVVLKRLSQAVADKDPIHAVIRGTAVNHDGHTSGFLTPSRAGQQEMLRGAWKSAGVDARDIRYIEMHGTGTNVGDPIEIGSVGAVLKENGVSQPCWLGSVKTNLGHTEAASGVAGLIKAVLALQHRTIPPSLHCKVLNPRVAWESEPVRIATAAVDLSGQREPLLAGVNSFGLSGTNAHVVLEEVMQSPAKSSPESGPYLLPVSARTPEALTALLRAHLEALRRGGEGYPLGDVCYTSGVRRTHHEHRAAIVAEDRAMLEANLAAAAAGEETEGVTIGRVGSGAHPIVFVAPGQGSQWAGMARELFHSNGVFRQAFEECETAIATETGWRLSDRLLGADVERHLSHIDFIQPALFTMSVALAAVWRNRGVEPDAVIGHSMGEVAAAHIAGILSLEDAAAVICRRSRLMKTLSSTGGAATSTGSMATVELPLAAVEALLGGREGISVGASNGPHSTVVSGDSSVVEALLGELEAQEIYCRRIKVDVASHSAQVDPILDRLFAELTAIRPRPAKIPMLSTVTGRFAASGDNDGVVMDARYWVENLRRAVLFAPAIAALSSSGHDTFVELSPHPILLPSIEASAHAVNPRAVAVASLRREKPERATLLQGLGQLYVSGRPVAWATLHPKDARCVRLPQYPFQRERYWPEPGDPARVRMARQSGNHSLLGRRVESSLQPDVLLWECLLDAAAYSLGDHRVLGAVALPVSGHLAMAFLAAGAARLGERFALRNAAFLSTVYLPENGRKVLQLALIPEGSGGFRFELRGRDENRDGDAAGHGGAWILHSTGTLAVAGPEPASLPSLEVEELKRGGSIHLTGKEHYETTARGGLDYGPAFQRMEEVWAGERESLGRVRCELEYGDGSWVDPVVLDACLQAMAHVRPERTASAVDDMYVPTGIGSVQVYGAFPEAGSVYVHAALVESDAEKGTSRVDLRIADRDGAILAEIAGMEMKRLARDSSADAAGSLYTLEWNSENPDTDAQEKAEEAVARLARVAVENWVVFADRTGIADAMEHMLVSSGGRCTRVRPGAGFRKTGEAEYEVDPGERMDLDRLFEAVAISETVPTAIVYLWALDQTSAGDYDAEMLMGAQALGSQYIPGVVQAISAANWDNPPRLWLVTAGAMTVGGERVPPRIESSPMWGLGSTVAREHAELRPALVDLSARPDPVEARALTLAICTEGKEDRIALRGRAKYVARLKPLSGRNVWDPLATDRKLFAAGATYLITGGLGGIALTVAEWMARNGAGHLALLSRRAPSAGTDEAIRGIEAAGAAVTHLRADVTRQDDLTRAIEAIHASGFPLKGILHLAGVVDVAPILDLTPERFLPIMMPKIAGAWNLSAATRQENLDFLVLFSSIAAVYPQPGTGAYAAANAFLDAFAHFLRTQETPAISIDWGAWNGIGMLRTGVAKRGVEDYLREGIGTSSAQAALATLRRTLESKPVQFVAFPIDVDRLVEFHGLNAIPPLFADLVEKRRTGSGVESNGPEILARLAEADAGERREMMEEYVQEQMARVLKQAANRIDRERPLGTMGLDSLMGMELVRRLGAALEVPIPATVVFNYPTIRLLGAHLLRRMHLDPAEDSAGEASATAMAAPLRDRGAEVGDLSGDISEDEVLQALLGKGRNS